MPSAAPLQTGTAPHAIAYDWLVSILRTDPVLRTVVKTWRVRQTATDDDEVSASSCPCVRLTPSPRDARILAVCSGKIIQSQPIAVAVETFVGGFAATDSLAVWDALRTCLVGRYFDHEAAMRLAYINSMTVTAPAFAGAPPEPGAGILYATGEILLDVRY